MGWFVLSDDQPKLQVTIAFDILGSSGVSVDMTGALTKGRLSQTAQTVEELIAHRRDRGGERVREVRGRGLPGHQRYGQQTGRVLLHFAGPAHGRLFNVPDLPLSALHGQDQPGSQHRVGGPAALISGMAVAG